MYGQVMHHTVIVDILDLEIEIRISRQQINQILLVDLNHTTTNLILLLYLRKNLLNHRGHQSIIIPEHGERLSTASAAISKDGAIVSLKEVIGDFLAHDCVHLILYHL